MTAPNCCPRCLRNYEWETDGPFGIGKIRPVHPMGPCVPPPPFEPDEIVIRPQPSLQPRECRGCGAVFQPHRAYHVFCVKSCRNLLRDRLRTLARTRDCVWCGQRFVGKVSQQVACGPDCYKAYRREYLRQDWQRRNAA